MTDASGDDMSVVVVWCAHTGGHSLDRGVCAPPCEAVHLRCATCRAAIAPCPFENSGHQERFVQQVLRLIGDETEPVLVVAII